MYVDAPFYQESIPDNRESREEREQGKQGSKEEVLYDPNPNHLKQRNPAGRVGAGNAGRGEIIISYS